MASGGDDDHNQPKEPPPPPAPPAPPGNHPPPRPPTRYSTQPFPGYHPPQPYPGYPPPPQYPHQYPNSYPYTVSPPPPATYYTQQYIAVQHHQQPPQLEPSPRLTVARCLLTILTLIVFGAFTLSVLTWLIFGTELPQFHVRSMVVPSFNLTDNELRANWDTNVTVKNSNKKLAIFFERLEGVIAYGETVLALSASASQPFDVGTREEKTFNVKMSTENPNRESISGSYENLVRDRDRERVSFSLRMVATTTFTSGSLWRRQGNLKVFCEDLEVRFYGPRDPGRLVVRGQDDYYKCLTYD